MTRHLWIIAVLFGLLGAGCDRVPTRPDGSVAPVRFTLVASSEAGAPGNPVSLHARVSNLGTSPLVYTARCADDGIGLIVRAPDRGNVVDPCADCPQILCLGCPDRLLTLQPGESVERTVVFDGTLQRCDGPYAGPAGVYAVEASFEFTTRGWGGGSLSRTGEFTWATGAAR